VPDADAAKARLLRAAAAPVIVVIDIYLPGNASGLDVLAWMRDQPALARLPVVVLSVSTDRTHEARARTAGAALVLRKPITVDLMIEALSHLGLAMVPATAGSRPGVLLKA